MNFLVKLALYSLLTCILVGCSQPCPSLTPASAEGITTLEIDNSQLYIPISWRLIRPVDTRPWRNGVYASLRGWGKFEPALRPLGISPLKPELHRAFSAGQPVKLHDEFFAMNIAFEFPLPPIKSNWWDGCQYDRVLPYSFDELELVYHAADEKPLPYLEIIGMIDANEGVDIGDGWKEITRKHKDYVYKIRFDAMSWIEEGGLMPRRLAASRGEPLLYRYMLWDHYMTLSPRGWGINFHTERLPLSRWRGQYSTAEILYNWLRTPPTERDEFRRFEWWTDIRERPSE